MDDYHRSEELLIERAAGCDDDAFCELCDRYQHHLRGLIAHYAPTPADLDDIYAEIIAKLLANNKRALRNWKPVAPFVAYLTTIAVRHCLNWLERKSRDPRTIVLTSADPNTDGRAMLQEVIAGDEQHLPDRILAQRADRATMRRALMRLSDSDRLVLALRFDQGMTGPEIGRALGISSGAARQRIFKALRRLAKVLAERDEEEFPMTGR